MSKSNSESNDLKASRGLKRESLDRGLPITPQNIKLPPVKQPKQPNEKK